MCQFERLEKKVHRGVHFQETGASALQAAALKGALARRNKLNAPHNIIKGIIARPRTVLPALHQQQKRHLLATKLLYWILKHLYHVYARRDVTVPSTALLFYLLLVAKQHASEYLTAVEVKSFPNLPCL